MGSHPEYAIVGRGDPVPEDWYIASAQFVNNYMEQMTTEANVIGDWAIIAFTGGKIEGTGYGGGQVIVTPLAAGEDPYYYVRTDPNINDTLIVRADQDDPNVYIPDPCHGDPGACEVDVNNLCNHVGYDCTCERLPEIPPYHRAITECNGVPLAQLPGFMDFDRDVPAFNAFATNLGYSASTSWNPIPAGNWGHWLNLDQP
jgi:hypothetical protein